VLLADDKGAGEMPVVGRHCVARLRRSVLGVANGEVTPSTSGCQPAGERRRSEKDTRVRERRPPRERTRSSSSLELSSSPSPE